MTSPSRIAKAEDGPSIYTASLPFDEQRIGAAAVYCSDGRFGEQMDEFLHQSLGLPRYDRVAVPGGAACLAGHGKSIYEKEAMERELRFLIDSHGLGRVVLIAHSDCGFYRDVWLGSRTLVEQQTMDLKKASERILFWNPRLKIETYLARRTEGRVVFEKL